MCVFVFVCMYVTLTLKAVFAKSLVAVFIFGLIEESIPITWGENNVFDCYLIVTYLIKAKVTPTNIIFCSYGFSNNTKNLPLLDPFPSLGGWKHGKNHKHLDFPLSNHRILQWNFANQQLLAAKLFVHMLRRTWEVLTNVYTQCLNMVDILMLISMHHLN